MATVNFKLDSAELDTLVKEMGEHVTPKASRDALNVLAREAEKNAIKEVAKARKLPARAVRNRLKLTGEKKERRTDINKATARRLEVTLSVWMRGIPVATKGIGGIQNRKGVKATGGRMYLSAFRAKGLVLKRKTKNRKPLFLPKIGVREKLVARFNKYITKRAGENIFREAFIKQAKRQIDRVARRQNMRL